MFPSSTFPNEQLLTYEATQRIGSCFHLALSSKQTKPPCPLCSTPSRRVHSRYTRSVADLPVAGYRVMLELQVKKFFCDEFGCPIAGIIWFELVSAKASPDNYESLPRASLQR